MKRKASKSDRMEFDFRPPPPPPVNPATNNAPLDFKGKNKPPGPPGETAMTPEQQEQYQQQLQAQQEMQKMEQQDKQGSRGNRDRGPNRDRPERPDRPDRDRSHDRSRERGSFRGRGRDFRNRDTYNRDRRFKGERPNRYDRRDKEMDLTMQVMAMQGIGPQALTSQQNVGLPAPNPPPPPPGTNSTPFYGNAAPPPPPGSATPEQWGMDYNTMMQMMQDPNMMQMMQYQMMGMNAMGGGMMGDGMMGDGTMAVKDTIQCKSCTLIPPNPNAPPPTTRQRPVGCRTVFVGGLPDNVTEEIVLEIFARCGEIETVRMSKRNFCHIRYETEAAVDAAIFFSGYRILIGNNPDKGNSGRLHVDFAQARDDQYEFECRQRQMQREMRHRQRIEIDKLRPPSPPKVVHYSDHEANVVADKLKEDTSFGDAVHILVTWLERGDCNKRSCRMFYSMIQSTNSHVRRLMQDKQLFEEELRTAKEMAKQRGQTLLVQFDQIEKVFVAASHQKVWDHFTKAQRKNIDLWKKQAAEIKNVSLEELISDRAEEEMDLSDSEDESGRKRPKDMQELNDLKDESDSLRCQVEAYKNELDLVKGEHKQSLQTKDRQLQLLQNTLKGMQQQLLDMKSKVQVKERTIAELSKKDDSEETVVNGTDEKKEEKKEKKEGEEEEEEEKKPTKSEEKMEEVKEEKPSTALKQSDARVIALLAMFLHVHPVGASVDYMWSYLQCLDPELASLKTSELETILQNYPKLFRKEMSGVGASIEKRWFFEGFSNREPDVMMDVL